MILNDTLILMADDDPEVEEHCKLAEPHFGLIVVYLYRGRVESYWHERGFEEDFCDTAAELPYVFRSVAGARRRLARDRADGLDARFAGWVHPEHEPGASPDIVNINRYAAMRRQVGGHPRQ
jgi:hypothetical protein